MQKGQQTEDKTCIKLGPGRLCARMETHQHPPPPVNLLYTVATRGREAFLWGGGVTPWSSGTGGACDSFSLNINVLGKTAVLHLAHFCSWGCASQACNLLGITRLGPFCGLGLCQTQTCSLFSTPVSSHHTPFTAIMLKIRRCKKYVDVFKLYFILLWDVHCSKQRFLFLCQWKEAIKKDVSSSTPLSEEEEESYWVKSYIMLQIMQKF
jgi:hypothetical protein